MKNVTITLEEDVARWARIYAAEHDTSVSRMLGLILREKMQDEAAYGRAMERFLERKPRKLRNNGEGLPSRGDVHER